MHLLVDYCFPGAGSGPPYPTCLSRPHLPGWGPANHSGPPAPSSLTDSAPMCCLSRPALWCKKPHIPWDSYWPRALDTGSGDKQQLSSPSHFLLLHSLSSGPWPLAARLRDTDPGLDLDLA